MKKPKIPPQVRNILDNFHQVELYLNLAEQGKLTDDHGRLGVRVLSMTRFEKDPGFYKAVFHMYGFEVVMAFCSPSPVESAFMYISSVTIRLNEGNLTYTADELKEIYCWRLYNWRPVNPWFWSNMALAHEHRATQKNP